MLLLHGAVGLFDEVGIIVAALSALLAIGAFAAGVVESRRHAPVAQRVNIKQ